MSERVPGVPAVSRLQPGRQNRRSAVSTSPDGGVSRLSRLELQALRARKRAHTHALRNSFQNRRDSRDTLSGTGKNRRLGMASRCSECPGSTRDAAGTPRDTPSRLDRRWSA